MCGRSVSRSTSPSANTSRAIRVRRLSWPAAVASARHNRQSERDRVSAGHDYEVNLKADLEIMSLHDKLDDLRQKQWAELLDIQREQTRLLSLLIEARAPGG